MAERKIVYLLVERGIQPHKQTFWRNAGVAYECRDGSLNLKLDIHPGITFNIRDPKSNGEKEEAAETDDEVHHGKCEHCGQGFLIKDSLALCPNCDPDLSDGEVFPCDSCRIATNIDEAHLLSGGGAICPNCGKNYKSCKSCGYFFAKALPGNSCPDCS